MSEQAATLLACGKVNQRLRVLGRDPSGYHILETIFLRIELADQVTVRTGVSGRSVDCRGAELGPMERNLAYRAAMSLREAGGPEDFAIEIEKRIPVGAGLGGGSADAAAVLQGLNALSAKPLPHEALLRLAGELGADVPFLVSGAPMALAWGRGERLIPLGAPPVRQLVLLVPPFQVSTADAYRWWDESRSSADAEPMVWKAGKLGDWQELSRLARNDLEPVVAARHPEISGMRQALLDAGASIAMMSGSGSVVFGVFERAPGGEVRYEGAREVRTRTVGS
jgi:4-diphosphocytidyl-2-C-methyl-D-erythritol kinase